MASPSFPPLIAQSTISSQVSTAGVQLISESRSWYHHVGVGCLHVSVLETSMLYFKDLRSHHHQVHSKLGIRRNGFLWQQRLVLGSFVLCASFRPWRKGFLTGSCTDWQQWQRFGIKIALLLVIRKTCRYGEMMSNEYDDFWWFTVSIPYRNPTSKRIYNYKLSLNKFILKQYHIVVFSDMLGWS